MQTGRGAIPAPALLALVLGALAIAFAPIFVRLSDFGPVATAFYRMALAWLPLWLWSRWTTPVAARPRVRDLPWLCLPGIYFACDLTAWHWSIRLTTVANATLLANLAPLFVTLGARYWFGEPVSRRFATALILTFAGLMLLSGASLRLGGDYLLGDGLGVLTAFFYGSYLLAVSRLRRRFDTAVIMQWGAASAAIVLAAFTLIAGESLGGVGIASWIVVLALAWFSHAGGQGLITYALAHLPAAYSSLVLIVQPVAAAAIAWILFKESLDAVQIAGAAVILCGIALASLRTRRAR